MLRCCVTIHCFCLHNAAVVFSAGLSCSLKEILFVALYQAFAAARENQFNMMLTACAEVQVTGSKRSASVTGL